MKFELKPFEEFDIELIDGDRGKNYPQQRDFSNEGYCLFLNAKNVTLTGFEFEQTQFISKEKDEALRKGKLSRGDVVLTTRGTVGNVALFDSSVNFDHVRINSGMIIIRADENIFRTKFLYFLFRSPFIQNQIDSLRSGTAQPQLPVRDIKKLLLPDIGLKEQDEIINIVSGLENKLRLNTKINQTLEQIARAIFKSWFVDFEPVKAKIEAKASGRDPERAAMWAISGKTNAELDQLPPEQHQQLAATAALFPDELVESELGLIPKGWGGGYLSDLCVLNAKSWGAKTMPSQVNYVDLANTKNGEISDVQIFTAEEAPSRARRVLRPGDTIVGTVRPGNRSFALIGAGGHTLTGSTGFAVLSPKAEELRELVFIIATGDSNIDRLTRLADGAAYPAVRPEVVAKEPCVIPPNGPAKAFHQVVGPMFDQMLASRDNTETLATLRNTLLPQLLSGEFELSVEDLTLEGIA